MALIIFIEIIFLISSILGLVTKIKLYKIRGINNKVLSLRYIEMSEILIDILGFIVKKDFRNMGIGNLLINELELLAKNNNYSGSRLVSGYDRENAHKFYQKHGYVNIKDQKNFIKIFD